MRPRVSRRSVVVTVPGKDVENHPSEQLRQRAGVGDDLFRDAKRLLVGIGGRVIEVEMGERAKGLDMQLSTVRETVEPARHEVAILPKTALRHLDPRSLRHQVVDVIRPYREPTPDNSHGCDGNVL